MRILCCKGCQEKRQELSTEVNCHLICEQYLEERRKLDQLNETRLKQSYLEVQCKTGRNMTGSVRAPRSFQGRRK